MSPTSYSYDLENPRDLWLLESNFALHHTRGQQNSQNWTTAGTGTIGIPSLTLLRYWTCSTACFPKRVKIFGNWIASGTGGTCLGSIVSSMLWVTGSRNMIAVSESTLERSYPCASQVLDGVLSESAHGCVCIALKYTWRGNWNSYACTVELITKECNNINNQLDATITVY